VFRFAQRVVRSRARLRSASRSSSGARRISPLLAPRQSLSELPAHGPGRMLSRVVVDVVGRRVRADRFAKGGVRDRAAIHDHPVAVRTRGRGATARSARASRPARGGCAPQRTPRFPGSRSGSCTRSSCRFGPCLRVAEGFESDVGTSFSARSCVVNTQAVASPDPFDPANVGAPTARAASPATIAASANRRNRMPASIPSRVNWSTLSYDARSAADCDAGARRRAAGFECVDGEATPDVRGRSRCVPK
jgi:hypothetical protein